MPLIFRLYLILVASLLAACSTVDFDQPKAASYANLDTSDTRLGRNLAPLREARHPESGFSPLSLGIDALSARLLLIGLAEKSLDVQYYLVGNDPIGAVFFEALLKAADRGVRVRLLIDDIGTRTIEHQLAPLDSHPNLQLRLFNPFANRNARGLDAWDLHRLSRRMHNKTLIADQELLILGGRNIATEYFAANPAYNFGDVDAVAMGTVARDASTMFDRYWNDRYSIPFEHLTDPEKNALSLETLRLELKERSQELAGSAYGSLVGDRALAMTDIHADEYFWSPYQLIYDNPQKALSQEAPPEEKLSYSLGKVAGDAKEEIFVLSPYFVPRKAGVDWLSAIADRGVQIDILTNGLAANDHIVVHGGYAPARKPLLRKGARFFELRGDIVMEGTKASEASEAKSKLHGKAFVVDRRHLFIGSFNWDPRSANLNTEMGVLIDSEAFAGAFAEGMYEALDENAYEVFLEDGALRWRAQREGTTEVLRKEPEVSWWTRFLANLSRLLPIRGQL
ncbi:phospholipase D family protein [Congregibacter litoralis]|uniref:Phosphatidylserine/phosphatidylglycerophosphate/ cardiolipin synthase n=1 Tax=Congregibacter litoralis KT71 TaxID=314285 RepID=A4A7U2_9GAMM|nr:phospholipase D family protein [Congregibacter litoralis]EAQ97737.1 Phosphatidylserine/phosphatidylglycerophosphate/cardiolipin synthase [Congregibacter litoralis KT71]